MTYSHWTTHEMRRLRLMHVGDRPTRADLSNAFPRHSERSVYGMAYSLGLRRRHIDWLRLAHEYFARREAGMLA